MAASMTEPVEKTAAPALEQRGEWTFRREINLLGELTPAPGWWQRSDGAEVWESSDEFYGNANLPAHRRWEALGPGQQPLSYSFKGRRHKVSRRWKTAEAAMATVDAQYPVGTR